MRVPLQISFLGMDRSDAIAAAIDGKVDQLERLDAGIIACRVAVEVLQKHRHQGRPIGVRIDLTVPGRELVVNRVAHEDAYVALRDAFDDMKRQLEDAVRLRRGEHKLHPRQFHGEVVRLNEEDGFGFIRTPDGEEYYFSRDNLAGTQFEQIGIGSAVQFIVELAAQGPQAKRVSVGKHHAS